MRRKKPGYLRQPHFEVPRKKPRYFIVTRLATSLHDSHHVQALFTAQAKLLAEATEHVFQLQTQKKENQHKVDRLHDYEQQIEQHLKIRDLWFGIINF